MEISIPDLKYGAIEGSHEIGVSAAAGVAIADYGFGDLGVNSSKYCMVVDRRVEEEKSWSIDSVT